MNPISMRKQSAAELTKQVGEWRKTVATMTREHVLKEQKNVRQLRVLRKDIARGLTILGEKKRESSNG